MKEILVFFFSVFQNETKALLKIIFGDKCRKPLFMVKRKKKKKTISKLVAGKTEKKF